MKGIKNIHPQVKITNLTGHLPDYYFFGYYDMSPWSSGGKYILAHHVMFIDRMPQKDDKVTVGIIDQENGGEFKKMGMTGAWNFQQGARLQWLPDTDHFIYNVRHGNAYGAVVQNIKGQIIQEFSVPVYTVHPAGTYGLSINFARLQRLGGYGYAGLPDVYGNDPAPAADGIVGIDFVTKKTNLILSINKVAQFQNPMYKTINSHHYLAFPTFNQSGNRFCFLHRFWLADGGFYTRLLTANPDGSNLFLVAEGSLSHFDWLDDEHILIWGRSKSFLTKVRRYPLFASVLFRPFLNFLRKQTRGIVRHRIIGDQYLRFTDKTRKLESVGVGVLTEDGHPTRFKETPWIIMDTYANKEYYRTLILYNLDRNERINLGEFYTLPDEQYIINYKKSESWDITGMRSDLHPRWNRDGTKVCIDSVHEGNKQMYVIDVTNIVKGINS